MTTSCNRLSKRVVILLIVTCLGLNSAAPIPKESATKLKYGFLRDVMLPIGLPAVSFYHTMRENLFLNTAFKGVGALESLGNAFLSPSRYLFAGKIARLGPQDQQVTLEQEFHYDRLDWLKTSLSLLVFPLTEPLGVTFKGCAFLSPEVRKRHAAFRQRLSTLPLISHAEEYRSQGIETFHSEALAPCLHHTRPSGLAKTQRIEIEALREITALLDKHGIIYWVDFGTCLGAYRYGGRIPWDWDIDIAILLPDHDNVKRVLGQLDPSRYSIQDWSCYARPKSFMKLFVKEAKNFIDIYHYSIDPEARTVTYFYTCLNSSIPKRWQKRELAAIHPFAYSDIFPLVKATYDGLTVWVPHNTVRYLQCEYGENLDPVMVWDEETQQYIKVEDHPYWLTQ